MNSFATIFVFLLFVSTFRSPVLLAFKLPKYDSENKYQTIANQKEKFGPPINLIDYRRARLLPKERHPKHDVFEYLKENKGYMEMDIKLDQDYNRNAIRNLNDRWPNKRVPYVISDEFNQDDRAVIAQVFDEYHRKTCIRFVPKEDSDQSYIKIVGGDGCSSFVGRTGHPQAVTLGPGCVYAGVIRHELMHALGFFHEQRRSDRDNYITIKYENIQPNVRFAFDKIQQDTLQLLGVPYDYRSVMHYGKDAFSINGQDTIVPHVQTELGNSEFSRIDIKKINKLYECKRRG